LVVAPPEADGKQEEEEEISMIVTRLEPLVVTPLRCRYPREPVRHPSWDMQGVTPPMSRPIITIAPFVITIASFVIRKAFRLHEAHVGRVTRPVSA
jgi:hypothetical protein